MQYNIIYVGTRFYSESGTIMSSTYYEDGTRCDWGKIENHLLNDDTISIRPATDDELGKYLRKLDELKNQNSRSQN